MFEGTVSCVRTVTVSVRERYKVLLNAGNQTNVGPWKQIWNSKAPRKVKCFEWLVIKEVCGVFGRRGIKDVLMDRRAQS